MKQVKLSIRDYSSNEVYSTFESPTIPAVGDTILINLIRVDTKFKIRSRMFLLEHDTVIVYVKLVK